MSDTLLRYVYGMVKWLGAMEAVGIPEGTALRLWESGYVRRTLYRRAVEGTLMCRTCLMRAQAREQRRICTGNFLELMEGEMWP